MKTARTTTHQGPEMQESATVALDNGYRAMAADQVREAEALAWCYASANNIDTENQDPNENLDKD